MMEAFLFGLFHIWLLGLLFWLLIVLPIKGLAWLLRRNAQWQQTAYDRIELNRRVNSPRNRSEDPYDPSRYYDN